MLERYAVKAARTVLRGGSDSNATPLPDLDAGDSGAFSSSFLRLFSFLVRRRYTAHTYP